MGKKLAEEGLAALNAVSSETADGRPQTVGENTASGPRSVVSFKKKIIKAKLTNILYKLAFGRKLLPDVRDKQGYVHSEVNLIKLGDLWFATVPGEMLPKLGLRLKQQMRAAGAKVAGVIGLANDELGYILPTEDFKYPWNPFKPGKHYEETNSIGKEIAPSVMEGIKSLL